MQSRTGPRFANSIAVVTGAASGIGAAVHDLLVADGATVVGFDLVDRAGEAPERPGEVVDISDSAAVDDAVSEVLGRHGRIDVVVNCAGVDDPRTKRTIAEQASRGEPLDVLRHLHDEQWRRMMAINLDGSFHVVRAAARVMVPQRSGTVVLVGSSAGFDTVAGYGHYAVSKAGVHALTQSAAKELIRFGVRVNAVAPGPVDTPMAARSPAGLRSAFGTDQSKPVASTQEIAETIAFLASPASADIVGEVILSNRGRFTA